jgi:hypothetical protein
MTFDLLTSEDKRSYFVNCVSNGDSFKVGAVYIAPSSCSPMTLVSDEGAKFTVTLPPNVTNQPVEMVALGTTFFID